MPSDKMKLLMLHAKQFWYKPHIGLADAKSGDISNAIIAFIHVEENDMDKDEVIDKAVGNLRWLAKKNEIDKIVLHSFAHLSNSKSDPETANSIIQKIGEELKKNFTVHIVPFGQFYEFSIHVLGPSLAKVFKDI
ncbi:MAG: threonyl-tRNA synthetase editing domain-containing protein [Acidobacteriota bacterium]